MRPEPILVAALEHVVARHAAGADYKAYVNDQLKSIRQDMTVQHIRNDFAVRVYETHARIALENLDAAEFNMCQAQLVALYQHGVPGSVVEFLAYRLLYFLYSASLADARTQLQDMTPGERHHPAVVHALAVRNAYALGNYHRFFALRASAPNHNGFLMELMYHKVRNRALLLMGDTFRPSVPVAHIAKELAFDSLAAARDFIVRAGGTVVVPPGAATAATAGADDLTDAFLECRTSSLRMVHELAATEEQQLAHVGGIGGATGSDAIDAGDDV